MTRARDLADSADKDITGTLTLDDIVLSNDMSVADNGKVQFGAGNDLQIFHDAGHSRIVDAGTGNLRIQADNLRLQSADGVNNYITADNGGAATLYHNGLAKLATTSTGVDVTGQIDVNSAARIDSSGIVKSANGSAAAPTHAFLNDPDNGMFRPTTNTVGFSTAGTERMRIDSSGVVTVNSGTITAGASGTSGQINAPESFVINIDSDNNSTTRAFVIKNNGSAEIARFTESGQLGLGTSSPSAKLHTSVSSGANKLIIQNTAASAQSVLQLNTDSTTPGQCQIYMGKTSAPTNGQVGYDPNNDFLYLYTNNSERMRILSDGKLALGSTTALEKLRVSGNVEVYNDDTDGYIWFHDQGTRSWSIGSDQSTGNFAITNVYGLASGHRLSIDGGGNVLIGKTVTSANTAGVQLEAAGVGVFTMDGDVSGIFNRKTSNGQVVQFRKDNTTVGSVSVTGSSTAYNTSSDYRLKENVADLTGASDRVQQLAPKRFNFIADADTTVDGFLAHEVQDIVPEAITGAKDAVDADGNPEYQGIDQSKLVPLLTAALQEALTKIDALETRIVALESN
jgi:hypothetical protein